MTAFAGLLLPLVAPCQPAAEGRGPVEQIIVTARKLPEDIDRVGLSVQALSGDFLETRGISRLYDLQFDVPGLVINNRGMFGAGLALRGVTDEGGASLAIAPHLNGVYLDRSNLALARMFDVERVEVVKGPQGTLYGRNATGGSVNIIARGPEPEFDAGLEAAFGSFDSARLQAYANLPAGKHAARLAVVGSRGDGYIRNSVDDRRFAEEDYYGIRSSLRVQPTPALTIDISAQHVDDDGASGELWLPRRDNLPDPNDIRLTTVTLPDPYLRSKDDFGSVNLAYEFGGATLRSITGYARNVTRARDDCAGSLQLQGCVRGVRPLRHEQRSQELRLESAPDEVFEWLVGAFYFNGDEDLNSYTIVPRIAAEPINNFTETSDVTAFAVFGDATRALSRQWSLTGGLRFSRETRGAARVGTGIADGVGLSSVQGSWDNTSWRIGFGYSPADDVHVYGSISTGFKNGGVTTRLLLDGEYDSYDPEELLAYDVGVNKTFPGQRSTLRSSVFYYDFRDMQVGTVTILANRITSVIDNAAAARIYGVDLSATTPLAERVTFSGALVWLPKREFVEFIDASNSTSFTGNTVSRAPEWSVSASIAYRIPLSAAGRLDVTADYNYRSELFFTKENDPILSQEAFGLLNLGLRFNSAAGRWYAFATARNLLDTDYFIQAFIQSSPGYPANYEAGYGIHF